jgi:hypothetical protein
MPTGVSIELTCPLVGYRGNYQLSDVQCLVKVGISIREGDETLCVPGEIHYHVGRMNL